MPRTSKSAGRGTNGTGSIRKITSTKNGKTYTYWQGRYTMGIDPLTGKQKQGSVSGKTQKEVAQKLRQITSEIDKGLFVAPSRLTVRDWLNQWRTDYLVDVKPSTAYLYERTLELHVIPFIGQVKLDSLTSQMVQKMYNELISPTDDSRKPLAAKSVKDVHGVLHKALEQAAANGLVKLNPTNACVLPKGERKEIQPLEEDQVGPFLRAIDGHIHEYIYKITMFTGLREGEVLGLTWDCVDLKDGTLTVKQQLKREQQKGGKYYMSSTKNGKKRVIALAPTVIDLFQKQRRKLLDMQISAQSAWADKATVFSMMTGCEEKFDLVFRNEVGELLSYRTVYDCFKRIVAGIGLPNLRFHDLRHTFALISIRSGDDIKTVQSNLGHATAAFTLDVYGHVTGQMKRDSANRMENFIKGIAVE